MTETVIVRRAGPSDADQISALFRLAYGTSSHPFQLSASVAGFSSDPRNVQMVAERDGTVLSTMAMKYYPWNRSFEWGRGVTHPDARRQGLAEILSQRVVDMALHCGNGELFFGFPRVQRILDLCSALNPAFVPVGHDGGRNVANSRRETHLVVCAIPAPGRFTHVSPPVAEVAGSRFIDDAIYRPLGLKAARGAYPSDTVVGPVSPASRRLFGFDVEHDPRSPDKALEILKHHFTHESPERVVSRIGHVIDSCPGAEHVSVTVLADKVALVRELEADGFECAAYLPAWYQLGSSRYDCVQLVKRLCSYAPVKTQFDDVISRFRNDLRAVFPCDELEPAA